MSKRVKESMDEFAEKLRSKPGHKKAVRVTRGLEFVEMVDITPDVAAEWLEPQMNANNRNVSDEAVMRYARDMMEGRWQMNGETIKISPEGFIVDGQHRLYAILEAKVTVRMLVVRNVKMAAQSTIDTGRARSFSDVCAIGGASYAHILAGAARYWHWYLNERDTNSRPRIYSHSELLDTLTGACSFLPDSVKRVAAFPKALRLGRPSTMAFVYSAAEQVNIEKARAWIEAVNDGVGLSERSPAFSLRERLALLATQKARTPVETIVNYEIRSWNAFYQGRQYSHYRVGAGEVFPEFIDLPIEGKAKRTKVAKAIRAPSR